MELEPLELPAEQCDSPEEALRALVLPFFEGPSAPWLYTAILKVSPRAVRACACWAGAYPAVLKVRTFWPEGGGAPRIAVSRWSGDGLTFHYAWRELQAQVLGEPPSASPPWGHRELPSLPTTSPSGLLGPLFDMLVGGSLETASEAAVVLGQTAGSLQELPPEVLQRLVSLARHPGDPVVSLPASLALAQIETRSS